MTRPSLPDSRFEDEPGWPGTDERPLIFLLDAASGLEERLLRGWVERQRPAAFDSARVDCARIPASRRPGRRRTADPRLERSLAAGGDPLLAPLRVAWLPRERGGERRARLSDLLRLGDPRDPGRLRQRWVARTQPERCRIVAGEPAPASELRARWRDLCGSDAAQTLGLPEFVARQAALALERSERRLRGNRYKVPRFVHDDILSRPAFRGGMAQLARELGKDERRVERRAERLLREIAATHSPFVIDLVVQLWRALFTRGYGELRYDQADLERLAQLGERNPLVFLPTHKSNLDHPVLQYMLHENGLPPNHTAGGINMNFFPIGPLVRRSGTFFIRRSFKDDEVYKFVLQQYIDYLIEKRFPLEWYIEGGRSRSGKLLPPRFGLLAYVVDAYKRGKSEDVKLVPVSIAYDQISDVGDYTAEQRGARKESEGFGWFVRFVRRLARREYGDIEIRFGEPVSLAKSLGAPDPGAAPEPDERDLALQKLAFEVCVRINQVTPITATSLVTLALLGRGDRALSVAETRQALSNLLDYVRRRELPTTDADVLLEDAGVRSTLESLTASGVLTCFSEGPEPVYMLGAEQHLAAAYYRNTVIHFFVNGAIAELALLRAAQVAEGDRRSAFWDEVMALRDLLKFEFFFAEKDAFLGELRHELELQDAGWEKALDGGHDALQALLWRLRPLHSHRILRPFLEAYRVVADRLEHEERPDVEEKGFLEQALALGRQYALQRHIRTAESVSQVLFRNALKLARNRGLLGEAGPDLGARRSAFAQELRDAIKRVDIVESLARARQTGLVD